MNVFNIYIKKILIKRNQVILHFLLIYISFKDCTDHPNTLLSNPHVNKLMLLKLSSAQATHATILLWPCLLDLGSLASLCPERSKSRTCLLSWGIAITPVEETESLFTAESALIVAIGERMFRKSHTLTLRSSELETTLSSRVNTADVTLLIQLD